jgi:hypothetical protein
MSTGKAMALSAEIVSLGMKGAAGCVFSLASADFPPVPVLDESDGGFPGAVALPLSGSETGSAIPWTKGTRVSSNDNARVAVVNLFHITGDPESEIVA